jgi:hypothetical protein
MSGWDGKAIWLQYYAEEWSQSGNAQFAANRGMKMRTDDLHELGLTHRWSSTDSDNFLVGQMIKYFKLGFSYATQEVGYDIRERRLTREEGWELIKEYDGLCGRKYVQKFCDWLGITLEEFWLTVGKVKKYDPFNRWVYHTEGIL